MNGQAIFFDLDGTLIDSELLWAYAMTAFLKDHGHAADEQTIMKIVYGHAWSAIYREIITLYPALKNVSMAAMAVELHPYYLSLREQNSIAIDDSIACLRRLATAYPIAVVSGSPRIEIEDALTLLKIGDCVKFFVGSEDYDVGKPDPSCYLLAATHLGADPARCLVIEDSRVGVISAKAAGMRCVALSRPEGVAQDVSAADLIVSSLAEVTRDTVERLMAYE